MKIVDVLKKRILEIDYNWNVLVLKGFPVELYTQLGSDYSLLDEGYIQNQKIILDRIHWAEIVMNICQIQQPTIMLFETFEQISTNLNQPGLAEIEFVVLENNVLERFENPSNESIPDFTQIEKEFSGDILDKNEGLKYAAFYADCEHDNGKQFIKYFDFYEKAVNVTEECFIYPLEVEPKNIDIKNLPATVELLDMNGFTFLSEKLFFNGLLQNSQFYILKNDEATRKRLGVIYSFAKQMDIDLHFYVVESQTADLVNNYFDLDELLKKYWGKSAEFRTLPVYVDPNSDKSVKEISQKEIIVNVIEQSIIGIENKKDKYVENVFLTAPTGAGKSLLFQIAAIYLAEKHHALTIVASPLQALMENQVENLHTNQKYTKAAFINGNLSPDEKASTLQKVKSGEIDLLYLSPEMLLGYEIEDIIGKRRLGLFVVDEAHCVTTWGQEFRVDYWNLGKHITKVKKSLNYKFPIFALTATAVYAPNGTNDMVFETIESLCMSPHLAPYIGVVRRDIPKFGVINFDIQYHDRYSGVGQPSKIDIAKKAITRLVDNCTKSIVYFPLVKSLEKVQSSFEGTTLYSGIDIYHGQLKKDKKRANLAAYSDPNGTVYTMLATKAFGMGIDIPDIQTVYHYEPNVPFSDYLQEIGRLARRPNSIGIAKIDFNEKDLGSAKKLRFLNGITQYQIKAVLFKILEIYKMKGGDRNLLVTISDFDYIFPVSLKSKGAEEDSDEDRVELQVKRSLLFLEEDLKKKYKLPLFVRPKNFFSRNYIRVSDNVLLFENRYGRFISEVECCSDERGIIQNKVFLLKADELWEADFRSVSFGRFKKELREGNILDLNAFRIEFLARLEFNSIERSFEKRSVKLKKFFDEAEGILRFYKGNRQNISNNLVVEKLGRSDDFFIQMLNIYKDYIDPAAHEMFSIHHGFEKVRVQYLNLHKTEFVNGNGEIFVEYRGNQERLRLVKLLNSLELVSYKVTGGEKPSIYIRANNPEALRKCAYDKGYRNDVLQRSNDKFEMSLQIFDKFFKTPMKDQVRWDFIEDYFLGMSEDELFQNYC